MLSLILMSHWTTDDDARGDLLTAAPTLVYLLIYWSIQKVGTVISYEVLGL